MLRFIYAFSIGLALLINVQSIIAQNTISGKIDNENNEPLTGANIIIKNTTLGAASDKNGNYSLSGLKKRTIWSTAIVWPLIYSLLSKYQSFVVLRRDLYVLHTVSLK